MTKIAVSEIRPLNDAAEIRDRQAETTEAVRLIDLRGRYLSVVFMILRKAYHSPEREAPLQWLSCSGCCTI